MLIKITKQEALDMLLDESMGNKVYFTGITRYIKLMRIMKKICNR